MKLIGLLGGMGWRTTATYYRMMNECAQRELGGEGSVRILLHSVSADAVRQCHLAGDGHGLTTILEQASRSLAEGGADFIVVASNSMHHFADHVEQASGLSLLHIADTTGTAIRRNGHRSVALLGTRPTMQSGFYTKRLHQAYGVTVIKPEPEEQGEVHRVITDELGNGVVSSGSRQFLGELIHTLHKRGADAVVIGCSELTAIVPPDSDIKHLYDTTRLHAAAAVQVAIGRRTHV